MDMNEDTGQMVWSSAISEQETDQFELLEEKVDKLIQRITTLKNEKEGFAEKLQNLEKRISDLTGQVDALKSGRDKARQRVLSLLEKLEQVDA